MIKLEKLQSRINELQDELNDLQAIKSPTWEGDSLKNISEDHMINILSKLKSREEASLSLNIKDIGYNSRTHKEWLSLFREELLRRNSYNRINGVLNDIYELYNLASKEDKREALIEKLQGQI